MKRLTPKRMGHTGATRDCACFARIIRVVRYAAGGRSATERHPGPPGSRGRSLFKRRARGRRWEPMDSEQVKGMVPILRSERLRKDVCNLFGGLHV